MKRRAKSALRTLGKATFAAADVFRPVFPGPRILIYHQVGAGLGRQMEVTRSAFESQVEWLLSHGSIVGLDNALASREAEDASRLFVVSFDDGYEDVYESAWPLLKAASIPFTLYLTTDPVESREPLTRGGKADPLSWSQITEMLDSGLMTLGAHTHTHQDLRYISEQEISEEVDRSNTLIEQRTGVVVEHFAYPWGYWSQTADRVVRDAYSTAVLGSGSPIGGDLDLLKINRVPVQLSDTDPFFQRKMTTGMRLEDRVRRIISGYSGP